MKKIKALGYNHLLLGISVFQNLMPAKDYKARFGLDVFNCSILVSDKDYKKIKEQVESKEKRQKAALKEFKKQPKFKLVRV